MTERERLIKIIANSPAHFCDGCKEVPEERTESIEKLADYLMASDVAEVVRCRECVWWRAAGYDSIAETYTGECQRPLGEFRYCETDERDFCSYGERREG